MKDKKRKVDRYNFNPAPFPNHGFVQGVARVLVVVGGALASLVRWPGAANVDELIYFDVPDEIDAARAHKRVKCFRIIGRETVMTLLNSVSSDHELAEYLRGLPAVSLRAGLAQLRMLGVLVGLKLQKDRHFKNFIQEVFESVSRRHNGVLHEVHIAFAGSGAGGTAAGLIRMLGALPRIFLDQSEAIVNVRILRVGSLTYAGLGPHVQHNLPPTALGDLTWYLARDRHPRETRSLTLTELPLVGGSRELRDEVALQAVQARQSASTRLTVALGAVNWTMAEHRLGGVELVRPAYHNPMTETEVAAEVCRQFAPQIHDILATPADRQRVGEVTFRTQRHTSHLASVEALVERAREAFRNPKPDDFEDACHEVPRLTGTGEVILQGHRGPLGTAGRLEEAVSAPCKSESDFRDRLSLLRGIEESFRNAAAKREKALTGLETRRQEAKVALRKAIDSIWPMGPVGKIRKRFASPATLLDVNLSNAIAQWREASATYDTVKQERDILIGAIEMVRNCAKEFTGRLSRLLKAANGEYTEETAGPTALVEAGDLDDVLAEAHHADENNETLRSLLAGSVRSVTLAGLSMIVGAKSSRPDAIIRAIATGAPHESPWWSGCEPAGPGLRIVVIPPVEPDAWRDLIRAKEQDKDARYVLKMADTTVGSINVLQMDVHACSAVDEVITPRIRTILEEEILPNSGRWLSSPAEVDMNLLEAARGSLQPSAAGAE